MEPLEASIGYALDLDLTASDADILALFSRSSTSKTTGGQNGEESGRSALTLKRERVLDVDGARAEWRVAEGLLVIYA